MRICRHFIAAVERELTHWDEVQFRFESGRTHIRLIITAGTHERFIIIGKTPSDRRAALNNLSEMRRTLRTMGLERRN